MEKKHGDLKLIPDESKGTITCTGQKDDVMQVQVSNFTRAISLCIQFDTHGNISVWKRRFGIFLLFIQIINKALKWMLRTLIYLNTGTVTLPGMIFNAMSICLMSASTAKGQMGLWHLYMRT